MSRIDPDEIIEGMQDLNELKDYFYDHFRLGMIMKKDYDYIFERLDEITDYLIDKSGYDLAKDEWLKNAWISKKSIWVFQDK